MGKRKPSYPLIPARWGYKVVQLHVDDTLPVEDSRLVLQALAKTMGSTVFIKLPTIDLVGYPDGSTRFFIK